MKPAPFLRLYYDNFKTALNAAVNGTSVAETYRRKEKARGYGRTRKYNDDMDVAKLKREIEYALQPPFFTRYELMSIYKHCWDTDAHLRAMVNNLHAEVFEEPIVVLNAAGEIDQETTTYLEDQAWFYDFRREHLNTRYWGKTVQEISMEGNEVKEVITLDRLLVNPILGMVLFNEWMTSDGIPYREEPFNKHILEFGNDYDLGLLQSVAINCIYKFFSASDWAEHSGDFFKPWVIGHLDTNDEPKLNEFVDRVFNAGGRNVAAVNVDEKVEMLIDTRNTPQRMYREALEYNNAEISKAILGNTESAESSQSSGYAQAAVHENRLTAQKREQMRIDKMRINFKLFPKLQELGHGIIKPGMKFDYLRFYYEREDRSAGTLLRPQPIAQPALGDPENRFSRFSYLRPA